MAFLEAPTRRPSLKQADGVSGRLTHRVELGNVASSVSVRMKETGLRHGRHRCGHELLTELGREVMTGLHHMVPAT